MSPLTFIARHVPEPEFGPSDRPTIWLALPGELGRWPKEEQVAVLDDSEVRRWQTFRREQDRDQFLASRFLLRSVLSAYLSIEPRTVSIVTAPQGKPYLSLHHHGPQDIEFSLSHTRGCIALLVSRGLPCGVDVERLEEGLAVEQLSSRQFFHASERARILHGGAADQRGSRFLSHWTLKEAYLKARGEGLAGLSDRVRVNIDDTAAFTIIDRREAGIDRREVGLPARHWSCGQTWLNGLFCLSAVVQGEIRDIDMVMFKVPF